MTTIDGVIERMKNDHSFRMSILSSKNIEERLMKCKQEGYEITSSDLESIASSAKKMASGFSENIPNTWLSGGPCHKKCAPVIVAN